MGRGIRLIGYLSVALSGLFHNKLPDTAEEVPEDVDSVFFEASKEIEEKYRELPLSKKTVQENNDSFEIDQYELCELDGLLAEHEGFLA